MPTGSEIRHTLSDVHATNVAAARDPVATGDPKFSQANSCDQPAIDESVLTPVPAPGLFDLIELILKDRPRLERIIRDPSLAGELIPRFLAISLLGFTFFGISLAL